MHGWRCHYQEKQRGACRANLCISLRQRENTAAVFGYPWQESTKKSTPSENSTPNQIVENTRRNLNPNPGPNTSTLQRNAPTCPSLILVTAFDASPRKPAERRIVYPTVIRTSHLVNAFHQSNACDQLHTYCFKEKQKSCGGLVKAC